MPIALAILGLTGALQVERVRDWLILGELSLDGRVRPIRGALLVALEARRKGFKGLILPVDNAREAAVVREIDVHPAYALPQVLKLLSSENSAPPLKVDPEAWLQNGRGSPLDFLM